MINLDAFQAQTPQSNTDHRNPLLPLPHEQDPFPGMHGDSNTPSFVEPLPSMIDGASNTSYQSQIAPSRIRSQTYSGGTPTLPEASLNFANDHKFSRELGFYRLQLGGADPMNPMRFDHNESARLDFPDPSQPAAIMGTSYGALGYGDAAHAPRQSRNMGEKQLMLFDDVDFDQFPITTSFENPSLGPTPLLLFDNLPQSIEALKLYFLLHNSLINQRTIGTILSVRVASSSTSKLALVEASSVETAMTLKAGFNHFDMAPGVVLYVAFARYLDVGREIQQTPTPIPAIAVSEIDSYHHENGHAHHISPSPSIRVNKAREFHRAVSPSSHTNSERRSSTDAAAVEFELIDLVVALNGGPERIDTKKITSILHHSLPFEAVEYCQKYGNLPEPVPSRQFDSARLRELKSVLEETEKFKTQPHADGATSTMPPMSQLDLEELSLSMLEELPELTYDYLGNTIVQKLFVCLDSSIVKLMMVKQIAPFFPQFSIHKNGTWAIQKIINTATSNNSCQEKSVIAQALKPYTVKLFNDQFGNYVLQTCARFGSPYNDFIFEALLDHFMEISSGRFGARCIRTLLDISREEANSCVTKEQQLIISSLIVKFARQLAVNSNGLLLINRFLDTKSDISGDERAETRYRMIIDQILPDIVTLATHKTGHLAILKVLSLPLTRICRELIVSAIFGTSTPANPEEELNNSSGSLEQILTDFCDGSLGPSLIHKLLTNPSWIDPTSVNEERNAQKSLPLEQYLFCVARVRKVLLGLNINNILPYKKLMEEVGLSSAKSTLDPFNSGKRNKRGFGRTYSKNTGQNSKGTNTSTHYSTAGMPIPANHSYYNDPNYMHYEVETQVPHNARQVPYPQHMMYRPGGPEYDSAPMYHMPPPLLEQQMFQRRQQQQQQQQQKDSAVMAQLEQLSLSSAAMGYNSQPNTPQMGDEHRSRF